MKQLLRIIFFLFLIAFAISSCRKNDKIIPLETIPAQPQIDSTINGFYLLNEGNMGTNMATLDYYDYSSGNYNRNIYETVNPSAVKELGDVGNDMGIYGNKLYAIINVSNKLEIMNAINGASIKKLTIKNCRYVTFANGKAYVSAYNSDVTIGPKAPNGIVVEIDTSSLEITRTVEVGRQPEELGIVDSKLYVANSGGYSPPNYERTISVIDLVNFKKIKDIDVAINLHRLKVDTDGDLYVTSRGDYYNIPSKLYVVDTKKDMIKKALNIAAANLTIAGDTAYVIGSEFSYITGSWNTSYNRINTKTETLMNGGFITDGTEKLITTPYGIAVDPYSKNIYITDAVDYVSSGKLFAYDKNGKKQFSITTGNIPAHISFLYKKTEK